MHSLGLSNRLALALLGFALASTATAAAVEGLYEGIVAADTGNGDRAAIAGEALKQVVVRVTGRRTAATDPALASLLGEPLRYAQTYRSVAQGQVAVGFDARGLDTALLAAGQRLWSRERPLTLLVLVTDRPGPTANSLSADAELRRELDRAAQQRGIPVVWTSGLDAASTQARVADALAGRLEPLRALARQFGADGVLVGKAAGAASSWTWLANVGTGTFVGPAPEAVNSLADRYAQQFATQAATPGGTLSVAVRGIRDLSSYAAATQQLASLDGVRDVAVEEAGGEGLRYRLSYAGDAESLKQAAMQGGRLLPDPEAPADGAVHFVLRP
jgi:hypothetical protein